MGLQHIKKKRATQKKQLPWIIVGGIGLSIVCVGLILGITLWQLGVIGNQTAKTTATFEIEETQIVSENEEMATEVVLPPSAEATSTKMNQPTLPPLIDIEGLPEDVVIFPENNGDLLSQQAEQYQMYSYSTQVDHVEVEAYFQEEMLQQGWQLTNTTESEQQKMMMYVFAKDSRIVRIYIIENESFHTLIEYMLPEQ